MSDIEKNKQVLKGYLEEGFAAAGMGDKQVLSRYFAPHHKVHTTRHHDRSARGEVGTQEYAAQVIGAVKGFSLKVERLVGEGDLVAAHWRVSGVHGGAHLLHGFEKVAPTGKPLDVSGVALARFEDGKIVEFWSYDNVLSALMDIGAIPAGAATVA